MLVWISLLLFHVGVDLAAVGGGGVDLAIVIVVVVSSWC